MLRIQYAELKGSVETRRLQMAGQMLCHLPHQVDESQHLQSSEHNTQWTQYMCQKATKPYKEYPVPSAVFCAISLNRSSPALPSFSSGVKIRWVVGIGGNGWGLVCTFLSAPIRGVKIRWDGS